MKTLTIAIVVFVALFSTNISAQKLTKLWETPKSLMVPESVKYDMDNQIIYVANINGSPADKDGNGFISKLNLKGEIVDLKWVDGLNAPKGMGVYEGKLYVTDIDNIVEIDIESGKIAKRYPVKGAQFLNDIDIDVEGKVYISDSKTAKIHTLVNGEVLTMDGTGSFEGTNGLCVIETCLVIGTRGTIFMSDFDNAELKVFAHDTGGIDGIEEVTTGKYIFSDWSGNIYFIEENEPKKLLISTVDKKINAADIDFIPESGIVLVPTFFDNRVMAYKLEY